MLDPHAVPPRVRSSSTRRRRANLLGVALAAAVAGLMVGPSLASAHLERPSYWPNPRADRSVSPPAGGKVPKARPLATAVTGRGPGRVRVVCQGPRGERSLGLARRSIRQARNKGFRIRPSQPRIRYSQRKARRMMQINRRLAQRCRYGSIQQAVFDSSNNDRVVIMPGRYTEPRSRRQPTHDPKCANLKQLDQSGRQTPMYRYHVKCPNDQSLIFVQGRKLSKVRPPSPPLQNRNGIPDAGECARCNLQIEGSGPKSTDVIIDAAAGYKKPRRPQARPGRYVKDVVMRVDRADGFVGRNFLLRGAHEHGFYTEETDGALLDRVKFFWNYDYGHLAFTVDHHVIKNCDGFGSGDAVVYPGASPETGEQADVRFYPDAPRFNTVVRDCDLRGSTLAYSGSMGNAVRITNNHIYGNAAGIATDTISASGHPGFPADSSQIDNNYIYSNNLNLYTDNPPVEPTVGIPVGVGVIWGGHNNGRVFNNWIFDNWRYGTKLLAVPDVLVEPDGEVQNRHRISCATATLPLLPITTSCGNKYFNNNMGRAPVGFKKPAALRQFDAPHTRKGRFQPNGLDFWWDEFPGNTGNCWFNNRGVDGFPHSITGPGSGTVPNALKTLPSNCKTSIGLGDVVKEAILVECSTWSRGDTGGSQLLCDWFDAPPRPRSAEARAAERDFNRRAKAFMESDGAKLIEKRLDEVRDAIAEQSPLSAAGQE